MHIRYAIGVVCSFSNGVEMMKCVGLLFVLLSLSLACAPAATSDSMLIADDVINPAGVDTLGGGIDEDSSPIGDQPDAEGSTIVDESPAEDDDSTLDEGGVGNEVSEIEDDLAENNDPVVEDIEDMDDEPVMVGSAQTWRAIASADEIFPIASITYHFSESGMLIHFEYEFTDAPITNGSFEGVNEIVPLGVDTEVIRRVTIDEAASLVGVERMFNTCARADLAFLPEGVVTLSVDIALRTESYFSSPTQGIEETLFGTATHHTVYTLTGSLSVDGNTIVWKSISGESTNRTELIGFPPQESSGPFSQVYADGETEPFERVRGE